MVDRLHERKRLRVLPLLFLSATSMIAGCAGSDPASTRQGPPADVRASWVVRTDLVSPAGVDRVVDEAARAGFNTLVAQVRGRGDAYFVSALEPRPPALQDTSFDPLARLLEAARARGLRVHGWVNANLVYDVRAPNPHPLHLVRRHPEWLALPASRAAELLDLPVTDPRLVEALEEEVRSRPRSVEGLYGDPAHPEYRGHVAAVCGDLVARYDLDGIHLDYVRYPNEGWGYSREALLRFRREVDRELSAEDRRDMDARVRRDPLVYTRRYPVRWDSFRRRAVDRMVEGVARAVRAEDPRVVTSAAVFPVIGDARNRRFQDWVAWLERGWLDVACPMNYAAERGTFEDRAAAILAAAPPARVWLGIGAWRLEPEETADRVRWARRRDVRGVILFSQAGLRAKEGAFDVLRRTVFGAAPAGGPSGP